MTHTLASSDKCVNNNLGSVEEITKLRLPDAEELGIVHTHPVLKSQHGFL